MVAPIWTSYWIDGASPNYYRKPYEYAVDLVEKIDYDFSKFKDAWMTQVGCSIRAKILDIQTKRFVQKNPYGIIINIGCGLDTRFFRVDNGKLKWYELDLPESMEVREKFFNETDRYKMISKSVFDFSWISDIKKDNQEVNKPNSLHLSN